MGFLQAYTSTIKFLSTFLLVLTVGCNVLTSNPVRAVAPITCAFVVAIYALGGVLG